MSSMFLQFLVDRLIQDFRARSQLLVSQHEEEDEVVCLLSDTSESEDEVEETPTRYCGYPFSFSQFGASYMTETVAQSVSQSLLTHSLTHSLTHPLTH